MDAPSDSRALPLSGLSAISADVRVGQFVWTSTVGYRLTDNKKFKADASVGARYWHLGRRLNFNPSILGLNIAASQSWADILVGGRLQLPLGPKMSVDVLGEVGGWNATAKLDYQFAGLLTFKLSPKWRCVQATDICLSITEPEPLSTRWFPAVR